MTRVTVETEIDIEDYLDEVSEKSLRDELKRRSKRADADERGAPHEWTPIGFADDLRTAFYSRNASRFEQLLTMTLEPHTLTPGLKRDKPTEATA